MSEIEIPTGMKAWHGGDSAPDDWDGGAILFRDGTLETLHSKGWDWTHVLTDPPSVRAVEIIAYAPSGVGCMGETQQAPARRWFPHLCFAGEPMHEGQFREPWPMQEEREAIAQAILDGWYEGNEEWDKPRNEMLRVRAYWAADAVIARLATPTSETDQLGGVGV